MNDVVEAKEHLTLQEAITYINQSLNENLTPEHFCEKLKAGALTLSVEIIEIVFVKKGKYAPFSQINYWGWAAKTNNVKENPNINPLDMYRDEKNKKAVVFENDFHTIAPGKILDIPSWRLNAENIYCLFSPQISTIDIHKLPLILNNDECFFRFLSPKNVAKDKIRKVIKKSKEGINEVGLPNFVAINSKNHLLDLAKFAEGISDPYNIEKRFFLASSRLNDFEHRFVCRKVNLDEYIQKEKKKRRLKNFNTQSRESYIKLAKLLSLELNIDFDAAHYINIEDKKSFCDIIDTFINRIDNLNKQNKAYMLNDKGYLKRAMKPNKNINGLILADAASAWENIEIGKDTIYTILREIRKFKVSATEQSHEQ